MKTVYIVVDQYPHREVASFSSLQEANDYIRDNRQVLNMPLVVSRKMVWWLAPKEASYGV